MLLVARFRCKEFVLFDAFLAVRWHPKESRKLIHPKHIELFWENHLSDTLIHVSKKKSDGFQTSTIEVLYFATNVKREVEFLATEGLF